MTWIDVVTLTIAGYSFFKGYNDGLISQLTSLFGLIFGAMFAGVIAGFIEPVLAFFFKSSLHIVGPISYLVAFILILIGFSFIGKMLKGIINSIHIGFLNNLGGAAFCALKWLLFFSLFLNIVETMDSKEWLIKTETKKKSASHDFVKKLMPTAVPYLTSHEEKDKAL